MALVVAVAVGPSATAAGTDVGAWVNKPVMLENAMTKRDLFSDGTPVTAAPGTEGGWTSAPAVLGADANYYGRAVWKIIPSGEGYILQNQMTKRDLLSDGAPVAAAEGGWTASPKVVGADTNYYNRGTWKITPSGEGVTIQNVVTKRYLFSEGAALTGAGTA